MRVGLIVFRSQVSGASMAGNAAHLCHGPHMQTGCKGGAAALSQGAPRVLLWAAISVKTLRERLESKDKTRK